MNDDLNEEEKKLMVFPGSTKRQDFISRKSLESLKYRDSNEAAKMIVNNAIYHSIDLERIMKDVAHIKEELKKQEDKKINNSPNYLRIL